MTAFADTTLPYIAYGKVDVRFESRFFVTEQFQSVNTSYCVVKLVNRPCNFQHQRSLRCDAGWVIKERQWVAPCSEHGAEPLKDRFQPLALPSPTRQVQIISASWSRRTLIRLGRGDRE